MSIAEAFEVSQVVAEDVIDSRDLIDLREKVQAWLDDEDRDPDEYDTEDAQALIQMVGEFESAGVADWQHGAAFVRDSYFEDYARELAEDIGAIGRDASWPLNRIDWEEAASDLQMDYTSVEVQGVTYWAR